MQPGTDNRRIVGGRQDQRGNRNKIKTTRLKGKCEELKGFVYDINSNSADSFTKTTREIAEYVARTVSGAGEFRTGMIQMQMPTLHPPIFPLTPMHQTFKNSSRYGERIARCTPEEWRNVVVS
jgi:hypothetical protein